MAAYLRYPLIGDAIKGEEYIYPKTLWEPEQDTKSGTVYFTQLVKGVGDDAKQSIINDGGFKGNMKKYDEDAFGRDISARFSWWSVYIDDANAESIREEALNLGQETPNIYQEGSIFGSNMFIEGLHELIQCYETCIQCPSEIRVLSTFTYKRQVQHAVVVIPENHEKFQHHEKFASKDENGVYYFEMDKIMNYGDGYVWHPFSTVQWDIHSLPPKQRLYAHFSFAFYLDPLPGNIMRVPEVNNEFKWKECDLEFELVRPLIE